LQGQNVEKLQKSCMKLNQAKFWESEYLKLFAENSSKITHLTYQAIFKVLTFYFCY
jgi:hypothetical protein